MPFEAIKHTTLGTIGIWMLEEPSVDLIKLCKLSKSDKAKFDGFVAERRKREFLASRILLHKLVNEDAEILYNESGKPALKNSSQHISISHSSDVACVFISEKQIGIDVEQTSRKIDRIATRFLHPKEQDFIAGLQNQQEAKVLFWAAKEAIFKCTEHEGIEFNEQIYICPFPFKDTGSIEGRLKTEQKIVNFKLHYFFLKNNVFVYCVQQ